MKFALFFLLPLISLVSCSPSHEYLITSPDKNLRVTILNKDNSSNIMATFQGDTILKRSILGLKVSGTDFTKDVVFSNYTKKVFDETWTTINGKQPTVRNYYTQCTLKSSNINQDHKFYEIVFRIYNDGFAYRYNFPEEAISDSILIESELTLLNFNSDYKYWAYNGERHNLGPVQRSQKNLEMVRIPMVIQLDEHKFVAIHEAEILDFAPFSINASASNQSLGFNTNYTKRYKGFQTSWRAFIIGNRAGDLVESDLLVNLNEPCKIEDPSWIKPGKTLWDWRVWGYKSEDGFEYGLDTKSHKRFIDFASENNIQYLLLDADWYGAEFSDTSDPTTSREGIDIEDCMQYAQAKNIGIILYLNDKGAKNFGLERVLRQFSDWGAIGVKYGFMQGTEEEKVKQTRRIVELCAKYKLMVNFHDNPIPPSGDRRTWPNLVTKEFCHSQADAHRSYFPETAVNTPLINMIAGPVDACNGWFDLNNAHSRVKVFEEIPGTVVAEVAKLIVIYSGWSVLPDSPEEYFRKDDLFDCIRKMPAQYDGFKVLAAEIDTFICVARKAGNDWFIGSLTNREPRSIIIDMDLLPKDRKYEATIYQDAEDSHFVDNKETYTIKKQRVDYSAKLKIKMGAGGGNAIYLKDVTSVNN